MNAKTRQTLIINADRSPTLSSEWKDCESFSGKASGKSDAGHQRTFSAQTRVHSQLIGVCLSTLILDEGDSGVICSWLQIIRRVSFDTFFFPPSFLIARRYFIDEGIKTNVFPQLGSLPPFYLFAVYSKYTLSLFLPDAQVPSFVSVVHWAVTEKHEISGPLFIVLRALQPRLIRPS